MNEKVSITSTITRSPGNKEISDTKMRSFELYNNGISIEEIAARRNLSPATITEHLLHFISEGKINVLKFVSKEKLAVIMSAVDEHGDHKLGYLKDILGEKFSFTEIKAVINHMKKKDEYFVNKKF
jgi:ATP-dependent DNA helicase RecQ